SIDLGQELGPLLVRGKIDRIDRVGGGALVIDYKTGSTPIKPDELLAGRNFQMMMYLLAAQNLVAGDETLPDGVQAGAFWHIGSGKIIGTLELDDFGHEALAQGRGHLARFVAQARRGDFAAEAPPVLN